MNFSDAVPLGRIWAVPRRWRSLQKAAEASQKATCPSLRGALPLVPVEVRVTTVPAVTVVTVFPPLVMTSDVLGVT